MASHQDALKNSSENQNKLVLEEAVVPHPCATDQERIQVKEECQDHPESNATFVQPRPFQCLECHEDMKSMVDLGNHMREARHINISWAVQSNNKQQQQPGLAHTAPYTGRWFQKLDVSFRCSFCVRKATVGMSIHRFASIREVFLHILQIHMTDFRAEYELTTVNFGLCKICNGFINFEDCEDDDDVVMGRELEHYLSHGRIFLIDIGLVAITTLGGAEGGSSLQLFICNLCSNSFKSYSQLLAHCRGNHRDQLITSFRDFSRKSLTRRAALEEDICCLCHQAGTSGPVLLAHLASHNKQLLSEMGLLEIHQSDHKTSKMTCRCCRLIEKNTYKIVEHFATEHTELFQHLKGRIYQQSFGLELSRMTPASSRGGTSDVKPPSQHVSQPTTKIASVISHNRHSVKKNLPDLQCKECTVIALDTQSLKEHLVNEHRFVRIRQELQDHLDTTCPESNCGEFTDDLCFHYWSKHFLSQT
jgi:hypothetical protein